MKRDLLDVLRLPLSREGSGERGKAVSRQGIPSTGPSMYTRKVPVFRRSIDWAVLGRRFKKVRESPPHTYLRSFV